MERTLLQHGEGLDRRRLARAHGAASRRASCSALAGARTADLVEPR